MSVCIAACMERTWHRRPERHKHHGGHGVLEAHGTAKVGGQVSNEGGEQANHTDGDHEAGPAVPVVCRGHERKQNLPEDGEEVHDVVEAGRQLLLAALFILVILTWPREREGRGG